MKPPLTRFPNQALKIDAEPRNVLTSPDMRSVRPLILLFLIAALCFNTAVLGCSVPVFRYALEHWTSDPYNALVLKSGPLSDAEQALAKRLSSSANVKVQITDAKTLSQSEVAALVKPSVVAAAPQLLIKAPRALPGAPLVWSGPFDETSVNAVLESPARKEVAKRIGEGESAVWLFLESGDKAKDAEAAKVLSERLDYLSGVLALPKLDDQDIKNGLVSVPDDGLRLAFSTLRITRNDPSEQAFIAMLLATEPDLREQHEPIVFPIFGQARVLYALVGKGIRRETIDTASQFLIGSCSCQVKEQNPGADLLMSVDWKKLLKDQAIGAQDLPKVSDIIGAMPEAVIITAHGDAEKTKDAPCCATRAWIDEHRVLAVCIVVPLLLLSAFGLARKFR